MTASLTVEIRKQQSVLGIHFRKRHSSSIRALWLVIDNTQIVVCCLRGYAFIWHNISESDVITYIADQRWGPGYCISMDTR